MKLVSSQGWTDRWLLAGLYQYVVVSRRLDWAYSPKNLARCATGGAFKSRYRISNNVHERPHPGHEPFQTWLPDRSDGWRTQAQSKIITVIIIIMGRGSGGWEGEWVVVTKPWEPEIRHVPQDLTGGVRCTKQMRHRRMLQGVLARVGGLRGQSARPRQMQLARVLFPLGGFRPRVTEEGKTGEIIPRGSSSRGAVPREPRSPTQND